MINPYGEPEAETNSKAPVKEVTPNTNKNELDSFYSDTKEKPIKNLLGKATITFNGAWEQSKISDHELTFCIEDNVYTYLEYNVMNAFNYWDGKMAKLSEDSNIDFKRMTTCSNVDIVVTYYSTDSDKDYAAMTKTEHYTASNDDIHHATMTLYPNYEYQNQDTTMNLQMNIEI